MKYWVFQNNQVTGPYEPEDLPQVPGYSAETLVCTEGRKGTNMGDWQRAGMVSDLSVSLTKVSQLATAVGAAPGYGSLPPEPSLKDLAALGSLQEKLNLLDNTVNQLQETLRIKEDELQNLHRTVAEKEQTSQELSIKIGALEEKLSGFNGLRDGLDKAIAESHDVEATIKRQSETIQSLTKQLEEVKSGQQQIEELRAELSRVKDEQSRAAREAAPQPVVSFEPPPKDEKLAPFPSFSEPMRLQPEAEPIGAATVSFSPAPMPFDPQPAPDLAAPTKPAGKGATAKTAFFLVMGVATLGVGAMKTGILPPSLLSLLPLPAAFSPNASAPPSSEPAIEPPAAPVAEPVSAPVETPAQPDPMAQLEQQRRLAIELARGWMLAVGSTIGATLEGSAPDDRNWNAQRVGPDVLLVTFSKFGRRTARPYEFEVSLAQRQVAARNSFAIALFNALPPQPRTTAQRKSRRRRRVKPRTPKPASDSSLDALLAEPSQEADGTASSGAEEPAAQPMAVPSKPLPRPNQPKTEAADAELLDDLLQP